MLAVTSINLFANYILNDGQRLVFTNCHSRTKKPQTKQRENVLGCKQQFLVVRKSLSERQKKFPIVAVPHLTTYPMMETAVQCEECDSDIPGLVLSCWMDTQHHTPEDIHRCPWRCWTCGGCPRPHRVALILNRTSWSCGLGWEDSSPVKRWCDFACCTFGSFVWLSFGPKKSI